MPEPRNYIANLRHCRTAAFAFGVACCLLISSVAADEPEIRVAASANEIFVGESIDLQVEIRNVKNPPAPDMSAIKEQFEVIANGDESRNQSSTFIINGRVSQQNVLSHVYHFRLTTKATGDLTIPPAKATIDGKTLVSKQLPLRVAAPEPQDLVIVEIKPSHTKVYPTQPFSVTLRVLVKPIPKNDDTDPLAPLRRRPPHLQINWVDPPDGLAVEQKARWLQPLLAEDGVGFTLNDINTQSRSFFDFDGARSAVFNLAKGREDRDGLDGRSINYFAYELSRSFTPEKTGMYSLGPAIVKGTFVAEVEGNEYTARRLVAIAPAVSIDVREVPQPRPATFCGGIGDYQLTASASPTNLRVGDPLTLTLEIERGKQSGSLELISAPDLSANPQLAADFDLIDKNPTGRVEGAVKKFAYALRPKRANVGIPALAVTTFDPLAETFAEMTTKPISLEVSEAVRITGGDLVGSLPSTSSNDIKTRSQGIFQNITDPTELRDERMNFVAWGGTVAGLWSVTGCFLAALTVYRRRSSDSVWQRKQQARRTANRRLATARESLVQAQPREALQHIRAAIIGLIADTRNKVADGLTPSGAADLLLEAGVPADDRTAVLRLLEAIESAEYGGGKSTDPATAIDTAANLISRIAPQLERGA